MFDGRPKSHQNFVSSLQFHVMLKVEVEVRDLPVILLRNSELHIIHEDSLLVIARSSSPDSLAPVSSSLKPEPSELLHVDSQSSAAAGAGVDVEEEGVALLGFHPELGPEHHGDRGGAGVVGHQGALQHCGPHHGLGEDVVVIVTQLDGHINLRSWGEEQSNTCQVDGGVRLQLETIAVEIRFVIEENIGECLLIDTHV